MFGSLWIVLLVAFVALSGFLGGSSSITSLLLSLFAPAK